MGKQKEIVTCRYAHCKHEQKTLRRDEAVKDGRFYYHPDCYKEKELMRKIEQYYIDHIEGQPIMQQLRKVLNNLVYVQGRDPAYILFMLEYVVKNKIPLKHPPGLYYTVNNDEIMKAWNKSQQPIYKEFDFADVEDLNPTVGYGPQHSTGFGRILNGAV